MDASLPLIRVDVAVSRDLSSAIARHGVGMPQLSPELGSSAVILTSRPRNGFRTVPAGHDHASRDLARLLSEIAPASIIRPAPAIQAWRQAFERVDLSRRDPEMGSVRLDARVTSASTRIIAASAESGTFALGLWREFAHPRERLLSLARGTHIQWSAALAALFSPVRILIAVPHERWWSVASTTDQIAADLLGLALTSARSDALEAAVPWENPLVQRATELDIGVRLPRQLRLDWTVVDLPVADHPGARSFADRVAALLGVDDVAWTDTPEHG